MQQQGGHKAGGPGRKAHMAWLPHAFLAGRKDNGRCRAGAASCNARARQAMMSTQPRQAQAHCQAGRSHNTIRTARCNGLRIGRWAAGAVRAHRLTHPPTAPPRPAGPTRRKLGTCGHCLFAPTWVRTRMALLAFRPEKLLRAQMPTAASHMSACRHRQEVRAKAHHHGRAVDVRVYPCTGCARIVYACARTSHTTHYIGRCLSHMS